MIRAGEFKEIISCRVTEIFNLSIKEDYLKVIFSKYIKSKNDL